MKTDLLDRHCSAFGKVGSSIGWKRQPRNIIRRRVERVKTRFSKSTNTD